MPNKIGILVSATDTGTPGTGTGVWDGYVTILKSQISASPSQYREEPNTSSHGAQGHKAKYDTAANTLAHDTDVKVIVTGGAFAAQYVQNYTTTKPLVVASAGDFSKLTGNFTGCNNGQTNQAISNNRIQIMNSKWSPVKVFVAGNDDPTIPNNPVATAMTYVLGQLGNGQRISLQDNGSDVPNLQTTLHSNKVSGGINVLYVCSDPFVRTNGAFIVQAAHYEGMKTMHEFAEWVSPQQGGDLSYGPNFNDLFSIAGIFVNQIFNYGTPAANFPVFNPTVANCVVV
jgi:hypothetical protein